MLLIFQTKVNKERRMILKILKAITILELLPIRNHCVT